jgi:hypothetical protein
MNSCIIVSIGGVSRERTTYMKSLHSLDILLRGLGGFTVGIVEFRLDEEFGCSVRVATASVGSYLLHDARIYLATAHRLHHRQMLEVIVRLEEGVASKELNQNAANAPYVAGEAPAKLEDDLWGTVVTG